MRILAFAAIALGIVGTIFFLNFLSGPDETTEKKPAEKTTKASEPVSDGPKAPESQEPPPPTMEIIYAPETAKTDGLVSYSDNVFVGEVVEPVSHEPWTSTIPGDEKPQTQWSVRVGEVLKSSGEAPVSQGGEVVVNQIGGPDRKSGETYVV